MDLYHPNVLRVVVARDTDGPGDVDPVTALALRVAHGVRNLPADLGTAAAFVILTNFVVLAPVLRDTPLRVVVGLPFVLFVPGYAFIAALFPEAGNSPETVVEGPGDSETSSEGAEGITDRGIDGIERVALSFGLSIAVVPLIGLVLNFTPWGIRLVPILVSVSGFTLVAVAIAAVRRWELPENERFQVPYETWATEARTELFEPDTRTDAALNILLAVSVLLAMSSVGYAVVVPQQGEQFSELYLLTEEENGDLVADNYPTEFSQGESRDLVVGVSNQEHEQTNYTLLVQLQQVTIEDNTTTVQQSDQLRRFDVRLEHNETWHQPHSVAPTFDGENLRLLYILYRGSPPANPTAENAYRENHLWINVTN